jgi:hypothetical protein
VAVLVALFGWWCNTRLRETIETQLRAELTTTSTNVTASTSDQQPAQTRHRPRRRT